MLANCSLQIGYDGMSISNLPHSGKGQMGGFSKKAVTALGTPKNVLELPSHKNILVSNQ